jgi:NADPH:quinone reductase
MQAILVTEFGGPEVLVPTDVADPVAGPGSVLVAVAASDVLFLDTAIRSGRAAQWFPVTPPFIPGGGIGGHVVRAGADVSASWLGKPVVARTGSSGPDGPGLPGGGYATSATVDVARLTEVPPDVDLYEATAVLHDGPTALALTDQAEIAPGEWVLVMGAAGGLGALLVQLARAAGARVIGAARGETKLALIRELGADIAVDYTEPGWSSRFARPDVVFDGVGGALGREAFGVVADGGRFSAHGAPAGGFAAIGRDEAASRGVTLTGIERVQFQPAEHAELVRRALAGLGTGLIKPVIGQRFPLDHAAAAHSAIEARASLGKTLLTV